MLAAALAHSSLAASYGAAASLALVLISIYLAVLILFGAAEITELVARHDGDFNADRDRRKARVERRSS